MQRTAPTGATVAGLSIRTKALSGRGFLLRALKARSVSTLGTHGATCARIPPSAGPRSGKRAGPAPLSNIGGVGSRGVPRRYSLKRLGDNFFFTYIYIFIFNYYYDEVFPPLAS